MLEPLDDNPTVAAVAARWLLVYVPTARIPRDVLMAGQRVSDYLVPYMGQRRVESLVGDDFRHYRLWLQDRGLAPRTVRHLLGDARCMLNWAVEARLIEASPFPRRVMPRIHERAPDRLDDDEIDALLTIGEPQAFVIRLGLETGMRWGELCRADARHLVGKQLIVPHTKSARIRRIPVPSLLAQEIRNRRGRLVPYVLLSGSSFTKVVRRRSGVTRFHIHQLRHTFACRWVERGGNLAALQQILGHASVVTTQIYARLSDEMVMREAERISGNAAADQAPPTG